MDMYQIVKKLIGKIEPIGETSEDDKRFENLKAMTELIEKLLIDIQYVAEEKNRHEYSRSRAGKFATTFLFYID